MIDNPSQKDLTPGTSGGVPPLRPGNPGKRVTLRRESPSDFDTVRPELIAIQGLPRGGEPRLPEFLEGSASRSEIVKT